MNALKARIEEFEAEFEARGFLGDQMEEWYPSDARAIGLHLGLDDNRARRVEEIIRRAQERIDDLLSVPGPEGKSPKQIQKELIEEIAAATDGAIGIEIVDYQGWRLPGTTETYGDALDRIEEETHAEIRMLLGGEEVEKFARMRIGVLLHGTPAAGWTAYPPLSGVEPPTDD